MIIDTHSHYNLSPLHENWQSEWQQAQEEGVVGSIVVGTSVLTSQNAVTLSEQNTAFYSSIGIHPNECGNDTVNQDDLGSLINQLVALSINNKVIAIGECGLDYYRLRPGPEAVAIKSLQQQLLIAQFRLAKKIHLPLIIHLRDKNADAYWDFLKLYKEEAPFSQPFILHCVSGPLDFVKECLDFGAYVGIAGNVTYNNSDHIRSIASTTPPDKLLLETDAPFLPPLPHRGKICEPWMIQLTAEYVQEFLSLDSSQFIENTVSLFPNFKTLL